MQVKKCLCGKKKIKFVFAKNKYSYVCTICDVACLGEEKVNELIKELERLKL